METNTLLEQFKDECQVIEFKYEYPGYVGYEQYGIITELSESELNEKYKDIIAGYSPYILLDLNYKAARDEYRKNEKKHSWRATNTQDAFGYEDEEMACFHPELIGKSVEDMFLESTKYADLYSAIDKLTLKQKERIIKYYVDGKTLEEIACEEGVDHKAVFFSIESGIKKLKKFLKTPPKMTSPTGNK